MTEPSPATADAVEGRRIRRAFGGVQALADASFVAARGEIHALVGENGAGKSTMIKVLSGTLRPDAGTVRVMGIQAPSATPGWARAHGVGTVFQELTVLPWLSVAENLLLLDPPTGPTGLVRRRELVPRATEVLAEYGMESVDPRELVANLSLAQRQVVEIVRTLRRDPDVLFLDEPTAALAEREVAWLHALVRAARDRGRCVVFTSHRWREVEALADRITVFRNGCEVTTRDRLTEAEAVRLMTGRTIDRLYPALPSAVPSGSRGSRTGGTAAPPAAPAPALEVRDLVAPGVHGVSLLLRPGEILGIGGLSGQGQRELFQALFGALRTVSGQVLRDGVPVRIRRPADAIGHGIALVPEDRKTEGLLLPMSVRDNLTLSILGRIARFGMVAPTRERTAVDGMIGRLAIGTDRPGAQPVGTLSGGNQQKVLLGRWLLTRADVLLLYDVTRGVDVGTKHDIYRLIVELAAEGKALLLCSSETEEVAHLSHRVLVLRRGRVVADLSGGPVDPEAIVAASLRGDDA